MGEFDYIFFENNELQHIYKLADNPKPFHPKTTQPPLIQAVYDRLPAPQIAELLKSHDKNAKGTHGITALHAAVYANNLKVATVLLQAGADPNAGDAKRCTPLHIACSMKNPEMVETLITYKAKTQVRNVYSLCPIHYAVIYGSYDIVIVLYKISNNANLPDGFGRTPIMLATIFGHANIMQVLMQTRLKINSYDQVQCSAIQYAALFNQKECAELLFKFKLHVNATDKFGWSALHKAAAVNSIVLPLIQAHACVDDVNDFTGMTALLIACQHGHGDAVEILLEHKAITSRRTKKGQCAVHFAAMCNTDDRSLEALLKHGADVNVKCWKGFTPLLLSIMHGKCTRSKLLLDAGANPMMVDKDRNAPLHYAASKGHDVLVATLVQAGADVQWRGLHGRTALHVGCIAGHVECCRKLIQLGSEIEARDAKGRTALHLAAHFGNLDCLELLVANRADTDAKCNQGRIPLHYAALEGKPECLATLIRIGSDPNLQDTNGVSALHLASCGDLNSDYILNLLEHKADPFLVDNKGFISVSYALAAGNVKGLTTLVDFIGLNSFQREGMSSETPLHLAAKLGNVDILRVIMDYYESYDLKTEEGLTPLIVAAIRGDTESMKLLISFGADVEKCDHLGMRALHYAAINGRTETLRFLLEMEKEGEQRVDLENYRKQTSFQLAVLHQQIDCVTLLLEKGANAGHLDENGCNALHFAVYSGNKRILKLLLDAGLSTNTREKNGKTPLMLAATQRNVATVRTLIPFMTPEGIHIVDNNNWSALHWACYKASEDIVAFFVVENKFFQDCYSPASDITPLHLAALMGKSKICQMLVNSFGKEILLENDKLNRSPLYFAAFTANFDLVQFLIKNGAAMNIPRKKYKLTPLMIGAIFNRAVFCQLCSKCEEVNQRVDTDILGNTALIWACKQNANAAAKMILDNQSKLEYINHANKDGKQAIHYAARNGMNRAVQRLLEKGSDVSWRDVPNVEKAMAEIEAKEGDVVSYKLILRHVTLKHLREKREKEEERKTKEALTVAETENKN